MAENEIAIEPREGIGKGVARKLRAAGRIPGVFYGKGESKSISLEPRPLERLLATSAAGLNTLISLKGAGLDGKQVLVKQLQRDPVRGELLHADLFAIDVTQTVHVQVPVHLIGTPAGVALEGGILDQTIREIEVECLPTAIPEDVSVDISELALGSSLHVSEIPLPSGVALISDGELSVASVVMPKVVEEEVPTEEVEEGAEAAPSATGEEAPKAEDAPAEGGGD